LRAQAKELEAAGKRPDALLPECFAMVREASRRTLGLRHYDVQILGGVALHRGNIAEMKTGEGKTLAATLPVALGALGGRGVHVVTVNDYLAARDAAWMRPVYEMLGLTVGVVTEDMDPEGERERRKGAYSSDVTYVTNHELVFDYLRDNLALTPEEVVLRPLHFAVVDEVDFLLLDEARTPLIISGPAGGDVSLCLEARRMVAPLREGLHFKVEHKTRSVSVLEKGWAALEKAVGVRNLADAEHLEWQHVLHNALLAHGVWERDVDYIVEGDRVLLVDEFTGRVSRDKRLADGLHQAIEAKEGVEVRAEDVTLAKTSYQNYFRLYPRLCGMTGTAFSARQELARTYGLRVVVVPTHRPMIRRDWEEQVFKTGDEKFDAVMAEIEELRRNGRPVLVGTTSVRESELLSERLAKASVPHEVLNAKNHEAEAAVVAQAGRSAAVTISTNMAGRGVDILLGGNAEALGAASEGPCETDRSAIEVECAKDRTRVTAAGGLAVLGTGLHEAKRIDDQLRGRAGRQGDPGSSQFFLSLEDPIYKKFGKNLQFPEVLTALRQRLADHPAGEPVTDGQVLHTLKELRKKVEIENEEIRKEVLKYDLVMEQQRQVIFGWRRQLLGQSPEAVETLAKEMLGDVGEDLAYRHFAGEPALTREHYEGFAGEVAARYDLDMELEALGPEADWSPALFSGALQAQLSGEMREYDKALDWLLPRETRLEATRQILLATIDSLWTDHLTVLERLDEGIGLRGYAELDPLVEFRREAGILFQDLLREIRLEAVAALMDFFDRAISGEDEAPGPSDLDEGDERDEGDEDRPGRTEGPDRDANAGGEEGEEPPEGRPLLPSEARPIRRTLKR
jgi:preprotein translocase subunit SecA